MAKRSKETIRLEQLELRKNEIDMQLSKIIRGFNKKGESITKESDAIMAKADTLQRRVNKLKLNEKNCDFKIRKIEKTMAKLRAEDLENGVGEEVTEGKVQEYVAQIGELEKQKADFAEGNREAIEKMQTEITRYKAQSEEILSKAEEEAKQAGTKMRQYMTRIEKDYETAKAAYDAVSASEQAKEGQKKKLGYKLEEAKYRLDRAELLATRAEQGVVPRRIETLLGKIWMNRLLYLLILPSLIATSVFAYWPMSGIILAFKSEYIFADGFFGSPWADKSGFQNFYYLFFQDPKFSMALRNTLIISLGKYITATTFFIILALLINEIRNKAFRRSIQTIVYIPHFLSWVVMASFLLLIFGSMGTLNTIITRKFHGDPINILANIKYFRTVLYVTNIWKDGGWGSIIYLAAIMGIPQGLYEAALIDGANRFKQVLYITLPCLKGTISTMVILGLGHVMASGFDQILNLATPQVNEVAFVLEWYVLLKATTGNGGKDQALGTAAGLFTSSINFFMVLLTDRISKWLGEDGIL